MLARDVIGQRARAPRAVPDGAGGRVDVCAAHGLDRYGPEVVASALLAEAMAARVTACGPGADLAEVAEIMLAHDVREVLVVDGGDVLGVVSDRDLLRTLLRPDSHRQPVDTVVTIDEVWLHQPLVTPIGSR